MVHAPLLLVTGYLYGTLLYSTGPLYISMNISLISPLFITFTGTLNHNQNKTKQKPFYPYDTLLSSTSHWISLWYTIISYWHTSNPYVTLLSSTGPLDISMVHSLFSIGPLAIPMLHCYFLLVNWISLWNTTLSYWPTGYLNGTRSFSIGPLAISMVHFYLLLSYWLSIWYTTISY